MPEAPFEVAVTVIFWLALGLVTTISSEQVPFLPVTQGLFPDRKAALLALSLHCTTAPATALPLLLVTFAVNVCVPSGR